LIGGFGYALPAGGRPAKAAETTYQNTRAFLFARLENAVRTWIKLYTEVLHDPKMHALTDKQFRACINLFALAGYTDKDGMIGTFEDIRFHLRLSRRDTESVLKRLEVVSVVQFDEPNYTVTAFSKRNGQSPSQSNENVLQRVHAYRARKQGELETRNDDVTTLHSERNEDVTTLDKNRIEENREDKNRVDTNTPAKPDKSALLIKDVSIDLQDALDKGYQSIGRKSPQYFKNEQQREAYRAAIESLDGQSKILIDKGISRERTSLSALLAWLETCAKNQNGNGRTGSAEPSNPMLRAIMRSEGKLT
jgi:hypothetical protein